MAVERERFAGAHPGDRQQPDQRLVTRGAQRRSEPSCGRDQRRDLLRRCRCMARSAGDARAAGPWREPRWRGRSSRDAARTRARPTAAGASGAGARPTGIRAHSSASSVVIRSAPACSRNSTNPSSSRPSWGISNPSRRRSAQIVSQRFAKRAHAAPPSCDGHGRASAPQRLAVDLGVYRGGLLLAVAQHLADLRQRRALP